jgi:hypothetical protein
VLRGPSGEETACKIPYPAVPIWSSSPTRGLASTRTTAHRKTPLIAPQVLSPAVHRQVQRFQSPTAWRLCRCSHPGRASSGLGAQLAMDCVRSCGVASACWSTAKPNRWPGREKFAITDEVNVLVARDGLLSLRCPVCAKALNRYAIVARCGPSTAYPQGRERG